MARYTIRILNKGKARRSVEHGTEVVMFCEFELVGEGYRDRIEIREDEFALPKAKAMIKNKIKKFLADKFEPIEYTVEI